MGQYYNVAINYLGEKDTVMYSSREVKGCGYIMAKLTEHSYFGNALMDSVAKVLYDYETNLAWIGDYAEVDEVNKITNGEVSYIDSWGGIGGDGVEHEAKDTLTFENGIGFDYSKKYLVNLTKGEYISFDEYRAKAKSTAYVLNPISILTAIGNGRGGGDFFTENEELDNMVGSWAWDKIVITDEEPEEMKKLDIVFEEV